MNTKRWALATLLGPGAFLAGCGSDTAGAPSPVGGSGGQGASNAMAGGAGGLVSGGASLGGGAGSGGVTGGSGGAAPQPSVTLSVFNVVTREPVVGHDPTLGKLERVELPPSITLLANVPPGTMSVEFTLGAVVRVDDMAPFLMNEDSSGKASWEPAVGEHMVSVKTFAQLGAQGAPTGTAMLTLAFKETGLAPNFQPLSEAANTSWADANVDDVMKPLEFTGTLGDKLPYRIFVPPEYDAAVKYPLVLFLHGRGDRGNDNRSSIYNSKLFHGARSIVSPNFRHEFPAIIIVPQCPDSPSYHEWARWYGSTDAQPQAGLVFADGYYPSHDEPSPAARMVKELVDDTQTKFSVDASRIYITGQSMGGLGTWDITWRWPNVWAAAVPLAGWTDPSRAELILKIPFWSFHSTQDADNNVEGSRKMVDRLKILGGTVFYTEYTDVNHGQTFDKVWSTETDLLPWIFSHQRRP